MEESGQGYPRERAVPEKRNKKILDQVREVTLHQDLVEVLKKLDQDLVKGALSGAHFREYFSRDAREGALKDYVLSIAE